MNDEHGNPPPLWLEQLRLGELPADREAALRQTHGDAAIDAAVARLAQSDAELSARYPAATMLPAIEARARAGRRTGYRRYLRLAWAGVPALAAVAGMLWLALPTPTPEGTYDPAGARATDDEVRLKGSALEVRVYRRRENPDAPDDPFIEVLRDGATARTGDVVQLGYTSKLAHAVLLSVDGRGSVTLHHPAAPQRSPRLPRATGLLDFSYQLDDAPGFERFYIVARAQHFEVAQVMDTVRAVVAEFGPGRPPELAQRLSGFEVAQVTLRKVTP